MDVEPRDERVPPVAAHLLAQRRRGGVLCPLSALPADRSPLWFLDWLARAGVSVWQILPFNPPDEHGSPYSSLSLFAGHPDLLRGFDVATTSNLAASTHWGNVVAALREAQWLREFVLFRILRRVHGSVWLRWPEALRDGAPDALARARAEHADSLAEGISEQIACFLRLAALREAANARGILLFGDMALYPALDSADVWANRALFDLDARGNPLLVAGVPPDYFSATGQLWGNPVYAWPAHAASGFAWWRTRITHQLQWLDVLRIDHFRGLQAAWCVPASAATATEGAWREAPGDALLKSLDAATRAALVAEDLGLITPQVDALRTRFGLPGMRVLQFAFSGDDDNPHLPRHIERNQVVYTGTHDNDTTLGWYRALDDAARALVRQELGAAAMPWGLLEAASACAADTAVLPLQDVLELGSEARLNTPGVVGGNWMWRCPAEALTPELAARLRSLFTATARV